MGHIHALCPSSISKATSFFLAHQNPDGGFGSSPSTVYETSLAFKALFGVTTDATVLGRAVSYLTAAQCERSSWNDNPNYTALAKVGPNLTITKNNIVLSNPMPTVGETITITANAKNTGLAAQPALLQDGKGNSRVDIQHNLYDNLIQLSVV